MNYRVKEMISSYTLLNVSDKLKFGVAYDVTMSDLYLVDQRGSIEFIFKYQF